MVVFYVSRSGEWRSAVDSVFYMSGSGEWKLVRMNGFYLFVSGKLWRRADGLVLYEWIWRMEAESG